MCLILFPIVWFRCRYTQQPAYDLSTAKKNSDICWSFFKHNSWKLPMKIWHPIAININIIQNPYLYWVNNTLNIYSSASRLTWSLIRREKKRDLKHVVSDFSWWLEKQAKNNEKASFCIGLSFVLLQVLKCWLNSNLNFKFQRVLAWRSPAQILIL